MTKAAKVNKGAKAKKPRWARMAPEIISKGAEFIKLDQFTGEIILFQAVRGPFEHVSKNQGVFTYWTLDFTFEDEEYEGIWVWSENLYEWLSERTKGEGIVLTKDSRGNWRGIAEYDFQEEE